MSGLARAFQAERVKLRKSWPLATAVLAPLCQAAFLGVIFWFSAERIRMYRPGFRFWLELNYMTWNLVLMPASVALVCALSWEQEREARAWNFHLHQPVPRPLQYLGKLAAHLSLALASQVLLALALPMAGWILTRNQGLLMGPFPAALWLQFAGYSILATAAVVAFQTWVSMRIPGLWGGLALAVAGAWLASRLLEGPWPTPLLPWDLSGHMAIIFDRRRTLPWSRSLGSLAAAALLTGLGAVDFGRRREFRT